MSKAQISARLATLVAAILALGLFASQRISFDTDPLDLLPNDLQEATGLQLFQARFGKDIDLMISIQGEDAETVRRAAGALTEHLRSKPGLAGKAYWQAPGSGAGSGEIDPLNFAELIAYGWMNTSPSEWRPLLERLAPERSREALEDAFETLAYGQIIDPELSMLRAGTDPLGIAEALPGFEELFNSADDKDQFQALDGRLRLVRVEAPNDIANYKRTIAWLGEIEPVIRAWQASAPPEIQELEIDWTGRAPYSAEIAGSMEGEMKWSVAVAIILIHSLFFLFYRRLVPIVWLVLCLALTFTITLTIGSFIFDKLGAMSVGFAAILIGLAVDYGFVIYQESLKHGSAPAQLRRRLGYSIGWASVTTAAVFICLRLSSLPGASQLGTMVGIGIVVGALVMLSLFTWLNHLTPTRAPEPPSGSASPRPPKFVEGAVTAGLIGASILVIILCGPPGISTSADDLKPKESRASQVFIEIWDQFGWGKRGGFQLVIAGDDEVEVGARLAATRQVLADDKSKIPRELLLPPPFLFANPGNQLTNRAHAREAVVLGRNVLAGALAIERPENLEDEHVEDTLALAEAIFAAWERFDATPDDQPLSPTSPSSRWVLDSVISRTPDPVCALGSIRLPESSEATDAEELRLAALLSREGVYPAAWPLLRPAIARIIGHEIYWVVLPTAALLFALLWLAFRRLRRVALSLAALAFSFLTLLAVMSLIGARWNLMNLASIPLLLGAGLDYSIHMQLALRRLGGDTTEARRTIGRALILCGLSTATGFGTLIHSSNAGLASLGLVCCIGILITMLTCVLLVPAWYRWSH